MLPTIHIRCSCGKVTLALRQGSPVPSGSDGSPAGEAVDSAGRLISGFIFDQLCLDCLQACSRTFPLEPPAAALPAWNRYHEAISAAEISLPPCDSCKSKRVMHPVNLAKLTDLSEPERVSCDKEQLWWDVYHRLNEYFESMNASTPVSGRSVQRGEANLLDSMAFIGELALRTTLGIGGKTAVNRWALYYARERRQNHRDFLLDLPKEFRNDFRMKQLFQMALDQRDLQRDLLREIRKRIDLLAGEDEAPPETRELLHCPHCKSGVLFQDKLVLGRLEA